MFVIIKKIHIICIKKKMYIFHNKLSIVNKGKKEDWSEGGSLGNSTCYWFMIRIKIFDTDKLPESIESVSLEKWMGTVKARSRAEYGKNQSKFKINSC